MVDGKTRGWRPARWMRRAGLALLALEAAYLLAGNAFLHTEIGRGAVNRRPRVFTASWSGAWTVLPGVVHVRGLELGGQGRRATWRVVVDRGRIGFWLPSLASRHVRIVHGRADGAEVEVALSPPAPAAPRRRAGPGWRVTLCDVRAQDLRRVRVGAYEVAGSGELRGGASFQGRGPLRFDVGRLAFERAVVRSGGAEVARRVRLEASLDSRPFRLAEQPLTELLAGLDGALEIGAEVDSLGFLEPFLRRVPWLRLDGRGELAVDVELAEGVLLPHGELSLTGVAVEADLFGLAARGAGRVEGSVDEDGGGLRMGAALAEFTVAPAAGGAPLLRGRNLEVEVLSASAAIHRPPEGLAGRVRLPPAHIEDLAALAAYLPGSLQLQVDGGSGELAAELDFDTRSGSGSGRLALDVREASGRFGGAAFVTAASLRAESRDLDLVAGRFDVAGSRLDVGPARVLSGGEKRSTGWWARVRVPAGTVTLAPTGGLAFDAAVEAQMRDTAPVVALLEQRVPKLAWFDRLLTVSDVAVSGRVAARGSGLDLRSLHVRGGEDDELELRADLRLADDAGTGAAYVRYRALDAAVELDSGRREWSLVRSRRRYEEAVAAESGR